ncbi:Hypothetical predicted protein [Octopus vulgaris]|uniref:Uncharacterized protein n=2 Tax=Octopus TaxID=6643 RepID=A0AA36F9K7_OCTVU|nr:GATOR complex protein NPRL3 [Octopus sinensis]CAI9729517.1 Hypothetical predicted protein [Octopus vulgaris]
MADLDPIVIILATSGSKGNRILFRYPHETTKKNAVASRSNVGTNPYAVVPIDDLCAKVEETDSNKENETLLGSHNIVGFNFQNLGTLLAADTILCGKRFDVKIKDVRFVGYPLHLNNPNSKHVQTIQSFNVVIVLKACVDTTVVNYYQDLAKQITVAIRHEECRCNYLAQQAKAMQQVHDESPFSEVSECPYKMILRHSQLARELKYVYDSLCKNGIVHLYVNHWVMVNFCLPHRVHLNSLNNKALKPEAIDKCLESLRPYHGILLLVDCDTLLKSLPIDCSPTLVRLISCVNPTKNLQTLSLDADLSLSQVFRLVSHLVYWAKAMIIYPLCENNMYVLSPHTNPISNVHLVELFERDFPNESLPVVLSKYSLPIRMNEYRDALDTSQKQSQKCKLVVWMLQHQILIQLHTYIFLSVPTQKSKKKKLTDSLLSSTPLSQCLLGRSIPDVTIDENCVLERTQSSSDIASVNSDESVNLGIPHSTSSQLSKSPSLDILHLEDSTRDSLLKILTPEEYDAVARLPAARNADDLKLFSKLCCYFNGKHHLEEIMYYEDLRRSQVVAILDKFRDILETCTHEDPVTSIYVR